MIEAQLPDGTTLQFPDGTEPAVIERAAKHLIASGGTRSTPEVSPAQAAEAPMPSAPPARPPAGPAVQSRDEALAGSIEPPDSPTLSRIAQAGVEGYQGVPSTQPVRDIVTRYGGMWAPLVNPLIAAGAGVLAAGAAGYRALQQAGTELINPLLGPQAARDIVSIPDAFMGAPRTVSVPGRPPIPEASRPPPSPRFIQEYPDSGVAMPGVTALDRLTGAVRAVDDTAPPRPGRGVPEPEAGADGSIGAAVTPEGLAKMDLDETKAARTTAEWQKLMEPPQKGDTTEHVLGVLPTASEIALDAPKSVEAKLLRQEFREPYSESEKGKMELIHKAYDDVAGTPTVVNSMERARDAVAGKQREAMFQQGGRVDLSPMLDYEQQVLSGEDGRRPTVRRAMREANAEAVADGNLVSDPRLAYGVRKNINDMMDKLDPLGKPEHARAMSQLIGLRDVLDTQMEAAFPGRWKAYLNGYHEASLPIDRMKFLQERKFGLTNGPDRTITFGKFDKLMRDIAIERAQKGISPAEAIDEPTMKVLDGIWKHLQRSASDQELARVRGSDTAQRMMELMRSGALHAVAGVATHGVANAVVPLVTREMNRRRGMRAVQRDLYPDITPRNQLGPE